MTRGHHDDPLFVKNSRLIRKITNATHAAGNPVWCIGCGWEIQPDQQFDIGHIIDAAQGGTHQLSNLGPQHRRENRSAGGRLGAARTNANSLRARRLPSW